MATIFCYTKPGIGVYPDDNYPGHVGYLCDWEQAMHLAWSQDGKEYHPLRNNTGILFAKAAFDEGDPKGVTKTLIDPWVFRKKRRVVWCVLYPMQPECAGSGPAGVYAAFLLTGSCALY